MESSEQISTEQELTPAQKILAKGIENFSPSCIVCTTEVPAKRARSRSKDTCSPECNQVLKKFRKHVMVSAHCPACYHPSTPEERAAFIKWRKERGERRERPGKPPKKSEIETLRDAVRELLPLIYDMACEESETDYQKKVSALKKLVEPEVGR